MTTNSRRLGIWHNPTAEYAWGLGPWGSVAAVVSLLAVLAAFIPPEDKIRNVAVVVAVAVPLVSGFAIRDRFGRHLYARLAFRVRFAWHRLTGRNMYAATWFSSSPVTKSRLPGLLAQMSVAEHRGVGTVPYAAIHHPSSDTVSVVIECRPEGVALEHPDLIEARQSAWAAWLQSMSNEPGVASVQVVSEAAPTVAVAAADAVERLATGANSTADTILAEMVEACEGGVSVRTWVAVAWRDDRGTRSNLTADVLPARVERLCTELSATGAGHCTPVDSRELSRIWAGMYDPDRRESIARWPEQLIRIADAGPAVHDETRRRYRLGGYDAVSLTMGTIPSAEVTTTTLENLARGIEGAVAVRWAQLFRPVTPPEAQAWSNSVQRAIETRMALRGERKAKVKDLVDSEDTDTTAAALARGAALTRIGLTVTVTVQGDADINGPIQRVRNACAPLSAQLRVMDGAHQTSWVSTLPGGVPVPEALRPVEGLTNG